MSSSVSPAANSKPTGKSLVKIPTSMDRLIALRDSNAEKQRLGRERTRKAPIDWDEQFPAANLEAQKAWEAIKGHSITITEVSDGFTDGRRLDCTISDLAWMLCFPEVSHDPGDKRKLSGWMPAILKSYKPGPVDPNTQKPTRNRNNKNVATIVALVLDSDDNDGGDPQTPNKAMQWFDDHGYLNFGHSTWSCKPDHIKFRAVIIPDAPFVIETEQDATVFEETMFDLFNSIGIKFDLSAYDRSQYFVGAHIRARRDTPGRDKNGFRVRVDAYKPGSTEFGWFTKGKAYPFAKHAERIRAELVSGERKPLRAQKLKPKSFSTGAHKRTTNSEKDAKRAGWLAEIESGANVSNPTRCYIMSAAWAEHSEESVQVELEQAMHKGRSAIGEERWQQRFADIPRQIRKGFDEVHANPEFQAILGRKQLQNGGLSADEFKSTLEALSKPPSQNEIRSCLEVVRSQPTPLEQEMLLAIMIDKLKLKPAILKAELKRMADAEREANKRKREQPPENGAECRVISGAWPFREKCRILQERVEHQNSEEPHLFWRPEHLVARLIHDIGCDPRVEYLRHDAWTNELNNFVEYEIYNEETDQAKLVAIPEDILRYTRGNSKLKLPMLKRITDTPLYAADGSLRVTPGYDPASQTYLAPGFEIIPPPAVGDVTDDDLNAAIHILRVEAMNDFPFSDVFDGTEAQHVYSEDKDTDGHRIPNARRGASSFANLLALILHSFVDAMIDGPKPSYHFDKPKMATGAGYLANVVSIIRTGRAMDIKTLPDDEEEIGKVIVAVRMDDGAFMFFDNINRKITSEKIAAYETATTFSGRILGLSQMAKIVTDVPVIFAGNNLAFTSEHYRRKVPIRLDAGVASPRLRDYFKQKELMAWLKENRARMVWSVYVLVNYWQQEGRPEPMEVPNLASYAEYTKVIGGILEAAGIYGFLANHAAYFSAKNDDEDDDIELASQMKEYFGRDGSEFTARMLFDIIKRSSMEHSNERDEAKAVQRMGMHIARHMEGNTFAIDGDSWRVSKVANGSPKRWRIIKL